MLTHIKKKRIHFGDASIPPIVSLSKCCKQLKTKVVADAEGLCLSTQ